MRLLFTVALAVALGGCMHAAKDSAAGADIRGFTQVSLSRGPCFGACPVYSVSLDAAGKVVFTGQRHVTASGEHNSQADPAALAALHAKLSAINLSALPAKVVPGSPACGQHATDGSTYSMSIVQDGVTYGFRHYAYCQDAPAVLTELENLIDAAANTARWIKGEAVTR